MTILMTMTDFNGMIYICKSKSSSLDLEDVSWLIFYFLCDEDPIQKIFVNAW